MDKQIIIDGVDVSGCTYYDANADKESAFLFDCKREHAPCWSCASMPGCLYKKYKRKEQECEELKSTLKVIADRPCLNINDCNGNCLPHCKWNAHKLAQEALKELE